MTIQTPNAPAPPIVERLRGAHCAVVDDGSDFRLCDEAADTIIALYEALDRILDRGYVSRSIEEERADYEIARAALARTGEAK